MGIDDNRSKIATTLHDSPRVKILVRLTLGEREQMKRLAQADGLTLNDYLIERGLTGDGSQATNGDVRGRELRERAAFEIRAVAHTLKALARRFANTQVNPNISEKFELVLADVIQAARCVSSAFREESLSRQREMGKEG